MYKAIDGKCLAEGWNNAEMPLASAGQFVIARVCLADLSVRFEFIDTKPVWQNRPRPLPLVMCVCVCVRVL